MYSSFYRPAFFFFSCLSFVWPLAAQQSVAPWRAGDTRINLGPHVAVLHDPAGTLGYEEARAAEFTPLLQNEPSLGFVDHPVWLRVSVGNASPRNEAVVLEIAELFLRRVDLYIQSDDGLRTIESGAAVPVADDVSLYVWPALALELKADATTTLFLRIDSDTGYRIPIHLYSPVGFQKRVGWILLRHGLNYGIGLYIFLSSLFIWYRLRDRTYAFYCLFQIVYTVQILALDGLIPKISGPFEPDALLRATAGVFPLVVIAFSEFFLEFSGIRGQQPLIKRSLRVVQALMVLQLIVFVANLRYGSIIAYQSLLPLVLYFVFVGGYLWKIGYRHMRYLFFACIPVLLMGVFLAGAVLGFLPHGWLFEELKAVNILSAMILALSLADRYSLMEQGYGRLLRAAVEERTGDLLQEKLRTEEAVRQKDQVMRIVSHDLRSPLSAIKTNLPFLRRDPPLAPEDQKLLINEIEDTVENVLTLSAQLLDSDSVREGRPIIEPEWCRARSLAAAAFQEMAGPGRKKDLTLVNSIPADIELLVDRRLMTRVFSNLVSNAVKFSRGGDRVEAGIFRNADTPTRLRLSLSDTGVGISPEFLPDLLDPTVPTTAQGTDQESGSGLGLILCREIAQMHGITLTIESEPGRGTAVHLDLPAFRFRDGDRSAALPGNQRVVLVVDDYEPFREQLRFLLRKKDIAVVEAGDGKQAQRIMDRLRPNLIVTDLVMPEIDGAEFIRNIRSNGDGPPIWVISGGGSDGKQEQKALEAGADRFFSKPLDIKKFREEVTKFFGVP